MSDLEGFATRPPICGVDFIQIPTTAVPDLEVRHWWTFGLPKGQHGGSLHMPGN